MTKQNIVLSDKKKNAGFFYGYVILVASFFILVILGGITSSFGVFLKPVLTEFGWSRAAISSAYSLNMIIFGIVGIVAGRISDRFNPRVSLTIGGLFTGLGFLLMSQVGEIWQIYLFYGVLSGIGIGFIAIPLLSLVARWFVKGRGLASGIIVAGSGLGTIIIPPLANLIISNYSWRTAYLVIGSGALVLLIISAQLLRRAPGHSPLTPESREFKTVSLNLQTRGISLRDAIRTPTLWTIMVMGLFFFFGVQVVIVHIAAHATDIGVSSAAAAMILSVIGLVSIAGTLGAGFLGDRVGTRKVIIIIFVLLTLSYLGFRLSGELWMLYLCGAFFGLGFGGFGAVQSPLTAEFFGLRAHGAIFSLFMFAQNIGGAAGPLVAGSIFDISGNYQWAFVLCLILSVAGLILSMLLKPAVIKT
jgi:MFS family permease